MARNEGAVTDAAGRVADWVEIQNPDGAPLDLSGMSLSVDARLPGQWRFPTGTTIPSRGFLVLWCDGSRPASTKIEPNLNTGHSISGASGAAYLFDQADLPVDAIEFGFQLVNVSIGRSGAAWILLSRPTAGAANAAPSQLGKPASLRVNEWMANPGSGSDWFEVFNSDTLPVDMGGFYLTDDPTPAGARKHLVAPLTFVAPRGWVVWTADGDETKGRDHVNFGLSAQGDTIRIYSPALAVIDSVTFGASEPDVSQGRLPDGGAEFVRFTSTVTPGDANFLPLTNVVINEVLSHTDAPLEDAIELFNPSSTPADISGWYLSNTPDNLFKFRIPVGTIIPALGYRVIYEYQFDASPGSPMSFTLNSAHGDDVNLSTADASGNLSGYRARQKFGAAENGVSFGRVQTSAGFDFVALSQRTFGRDNPGSLPEFRVGTGLPNAAPKVGPIVINEVMYHPVTSAGAIATENTAEEFIELHNVTEVEQPLFDPAHSGNTWHLANAVEFEFPRGTKLGPRGFLIAVSFDPSGDSILETLFRAKYGVAADVAIVGPFTGKLKNDADTVELMKPDPPQEPPHPDAGFVPYILVDRLAYLDHQPWPERADGGGHSLQRRVATEFGNDPVNWMAATPSAGRANSPAPPKDTDGDGMPDAWELAHGLDPNSAADANTDADGDGQTNHAEYLSGTNPRDAARRLQFDTATVSGGQLVLHFTAVAGHAYTVQHRASLPGALWEKLSDVAAESASRTVEVKDSLEPTTDARRFYRIVTPPAL